MDFLLIVLVFFALVFDKLNIFFYMLVSSLFHEAGHIAACLLCGDKPLIKVSVFGICLKNYPQEKTKKLIVIISGPLVNLVLILLSHKLLNDSFSLNVYVFLCVNTVIFVFNMLPVSFLDGGQLLQIFISDYNLIKITDKISFIVLIVTVLVFTENIVYSISAILLFGIYCYINKINLRY